MGIEPAAADATYTNAMDKISMKSQPSSQYSLSNRDTEMNRILEYVNQVAMDSAIPGQSAGRGLKGILGGFKRWRHSNKNLQSPKSNFREKKLLTEGELKKIKKQNKKIANKAQSHIKSILLQGIEKAHIPFKYNKKPSYYENLDINGLKDILSEHYRKSSDIKNIPQNLKKIIGMQEGGSVFESAPVDETAHDQMNNLIFENEMKQSQGASPFSFLNQDRIDEQNQLIMDAVTGSAGAMGTVTKGVSSLLGSGTVPKQKLRDFIYNKMFKASEHGKGQPFFSRVQSLKKQFESLKNVDDLYVTKGSRRLPAYFKPPGPDWYNPVTKTWKDELVPWSKGSKKFKELADKMIKEAETAHKKYYPEPKPPRQYQHGGAVFESAIPDETAHSQMNELLAQDEIQQMEQSFKQHGSMGVAPISFVGDPGSLDMVSGPFSKAGSLIAPFNKNIFSIYLR